MRQAEVIELQRYWHLILKQQGFHDHEQLVQGEMRLREMQDSIVRNHDRAAVAMRGETEAYWEKMLLACTDERAWDDPYDEAIMGLWCSGANQVAIVKALANMGRPIGRMTVRWVIRRYEMAWGVRSYSRKQRGLKDP